MQSTTNTISFLATGNEIIYGDIQDSNCHQIAKMIHDHGGEIYQHLQASDNRHEIATALRYLLNHSDVVIITGGLGPTSDDTTRFALADVIEKDLYFDEEAWAHIVERLQRFNVAIRDCNRQQAFFPVGATVFSNHYGTACGCGIRWQEKNIFMLPGPPRECLPMFHQYVFPELKKLNFFARKKFYSWTTMGLAEGEIAQQVDEVAKLYPAVQTGYRWNYPYLEVKLEMQTEQQQENLLAEIENLLQPHLVCRGSKNAFDLLAENLAQFSQSIKIVDYVSDGKFATLLPCSQLEFLYPETTAIAENTNHFLFEINSSQPIYNQREFAGRVELSCKAYCSQQPDSQYIHQVSIPNRGEEITDYAASYLAWQLNQFINFLNRNYALE